MSDLTADDVLCSVCHEEQCTADCPCIEDAREQTCESCLYPLAECACEEEEP